MMIKPILRSYAKGCFQMEISSSRDHEVWGGGWGLASIYIGEVRVPKGVCVTLDPPCYVLHSRFNVLYEVIINASIH